MASRDLPNSVVDGRYENLDPPISRPNATTLPDWRPTDKIKCDSFSILRGNSYCYCEADRVMITYI